MDTMLTVEEVAEILKVKPITVRQMYREKRLRAFKMGKAWRTTLPMLEEDIACISRGENPPAMPEAPEGSEPAPRRPRRAVKPKAAAVPEAVDVPPAPELIAAVEVPAPDPVEQAAPEAVMPAAAAEDPIPCEVEPATVSVETPEEIPEKGRKRRAKEREPEEASNQQLLF